MTAIYKKELKSYLTSMIGYLFMAFTLALFGLYFTAINLQQGYPEIGYALQNSAFILLIAVPVLTMRVLSEEQKNKTDQLLLTAPVKISDIILGKYLALLTIYVIPVLIMCLYPLLLGTHGTVCSSDLYPTLRSLAISCWEQPIFRSVCSFPPSPRARSSQPLSAL